MHSFFRNLFRNFGSNLVQLIHPRNLLWFALSAALTYIIVTTDFDWWWFMHSRSEVLHAVAIPAALLGLLVPVVVPFWLVFRGRSLTGYTLGQAVIVGWLVSSFLKVFTGRIPPQMAFMGGPDISHGFRLGFFEGGVFWGWPSSHTAVAFAFAFALVALYPRNRLVIVLAPLYALYIGLAVSISFHWFSEFIAGAIIGTVIGLVVGRSFPPLTLEERSRA